MQLPQDLQHFPVPTLIIAGDSERAIFHLLGGDAMEDVDRMSLPRTRKQDSEGSFSGSDGVRTASPDADASDDDRLRRFTKMIAEQTKNLVTEHHVERIYLVMPTHIARTTHDAMPNNIQAHVQSQIHADLMNLHPLDLVRRVIAEM